MKILSDEKWHTLEEIQQKLKLNESQTQQIIEFLEEYNFIIADAEKKQVKIEKTVRTFLTQDTTS